MSALERLCTKTDTGDDAGHIGAGRLLLEGLFTRIEAGGELEAGELSRLLSLEDGAGLERLFTLADGARKKYVGDEVHLRGLIEFSNYCRKNCNYCGIRRGNRKVRRYRMEAEEIVATAVDAAALGYRTVVLQSGEDPCFTAERTASLVRRIKKRADVAITLSIGERPREEYRCFFEAGADRFLLRFETSNRELYKRLHPDSSYDRRMESLAWLREIGYQLGSGVMIGLPGQTVDDLAADILKFRELDLDMVGIGPYICHPDTPLAGSPDGTAGMTFKMLALTRIVTGDAHIPATTALATLQPEDGREQALRLGANVIMPNLTPLQYRQHYLLYPGKICLQETPGCCSACISRRVRSIGRTISEGYGHSLKHGWRSC
jgi:biotin synthase